LIPKLSDLCRRAYYHLLERRVLSEHHFGQPRASYRLLHISRSSGLVLSAPALAFCAWYSYLAVAAHLRHAHACGDPEPLTPELFQLHLHDRLSQDLRRLMMPEPTAASEIDTYGLVLNNDKLDRLDRNVPPDDGKAYYVDAYLTRGNDVFSVDVRYRGSKHWHWNHPQKSWKIRVKSQAVSFDGLPTFNFINTPDPMPFSEEMVLDVAREVGLLAPEYYPFRLLLNKTYMGVYFFEGQPDEGLLRKAQRMPGSLLSGNGAPVNPTTGVSRLFESSRYWKKVAAYDPRAKQDMSDLDVLLSAINRYSSREFEDFAEHSLDVDKFAHLDALDVIFGCNQHDFDQNQKLYLDPHRGKFEPIATDFRDLENDPVLNRTDNPILLRLKELPSYITRRNRMVFDLVTGSCSSEAMTARVDGLLEKLAPDQRTDPYWDAYDLLPPMGTYYRQLLRPMTREIQARAAELRLQEHDERLSFIRHLFETDELEATIQLPSIDDPSLNFAEAPAQRIGTVDLSVSGNSGFRLTEVGATWKSECTPDRWDVYADTNLSDHLEPGEDLRLATAMAESPAQVDLKVYPGIRLEARRPSPEHGAVRAIADPRRYRLFIVADQCAPSDVTVDARNLVTREPTELEARPLPPSREPPAAVDCSDPPYQAVPGRSSLHPFCRTMPTFEQVVLGPGNVAVSKTRVFEKQQSVVILPGTTLTMSNGASLIFLGKLEIRGTADRPVKVDAAHGSWGGIALQGPGTAGSRLSNLELTHGTSPEFGLVHYSGVLNLHDTRDIAIDHLTISKNKLSDDALHIAEVDDFRLAHSRFFATAADAVDVEFSRGKISRLVTQRVGDDCIDAMGSSLDISDSIFMDWRGNAISAGERSQIRLSDSIAARGKHAILVKNASNVTVSRVLVYRDTVGVRIDPQGFWYPGRNRLEGERLDIVNCGRPASIEGTLPRKVAAVFNQLPPDELIDLGRHLLHIGNWQDLDRALDRLAAQEKP